MVRGIGIGIALVKGVIIETEIEATKISDDDNKKGLLLTRRLIMMVVMAATLPRLHHLFRPKFSSTKPSVGGIGGHGLIEFRRIKLELKFKHAIPSC